MTVVSTFDQFFDWFLRSSLSKRKGGKLKLSVLEM
jgi:hypothetical protein